MTIPQHILDEAFDRIYGINERLMAELAPGLILVGFMAAVILAGCIFGGGA